MIYVVNINNKEYEVEVEKGKANLIKTTEIAPKAPEAAPVSTVASAATPVSEQVKVTETADGNPVEAPMPGTILDIKVKTGDKVKKGQLLVILEAMKMENEIYAPTDGTIVQILVSKGSSVNTNETMIVVK